MAWQAGVAQPVPLVCYLDGAATTPTAPIVTEVNVEGAGYVAATNAATIEGDAGEVSVLLTADEMGAWGFVRVTGDNGSQGIQPFTSEGDYTAARAGKLDNLDAAVSSRLSAADVEPAPPNMSLLDITALGEVNMGAVAGTAVTGPEDLKADVSNLDVAVSSRSSHSAADVASAVWAAGSRTLTGFGTLVADVVAGVWAAAQRTLTAFGFTAAANVTQVAGEAVTGVDDFKADVSALALEATLSLMKGATFNTATDSLEAIRDRGDLAWITGDGTGGGDATAANQEAILAHLVAIKGPDWAGDDDTLAALAAGLAALPAEALAAIEAAHGEGPYDQAAMLAAKLVTSQFVAEGDELLFFRDTSPQAVSLVVSPPVDLSGWDLWLTIKPATPEVREEQDNASALCSVSGSGYSTGLMTFSVSAANVAGMSLDRAYDYSIEGKLGEQYRLFRRGTAKLTYNVRRNV